MKNKEKITKFIKDNDLDFTKSGSSLNGDCVVLSGFALHIGITSPEELNDSMVQVDISSEGATELERVFYYAKANNYGEYWESEEAEKMYVF